MPGTSPPRADHWGSCPDGPASPATPAANTGMRPNHHPIKRQKPQGGEARARHLDVVRLLDLRLGGRRGHSQHVVVPRLPYHRTNLLLSSPPLRSPSSRRPGSIGALPRSPAAAHRPSPPSARVVRDSERGGRGGRRCNALAGWRLPGESDHKARRIIRVLLPPSSPPYCIIMRG